MQQFLPCSLHRCFEHIPLHLHAIIANGLFWWRKPAFCTVQQRGKFPPVQFDPLQQCNVGAGGTTELSNVNYILYYPQIWLVINYANLPSWKLAPSMRTLEQIRAKCSPSYSLANLTLRVIQRKKLLLFNTTSQKDIFYNTLLCLPVNVSDWRENRMKFALWFKNGNEKDVSKMLM